MARSNCPNQARLPSPLVTTAPNGDPPVLETRRPFLAGEEREPHLHLVHANNSTSCAVDMLRSFPRTQLNLDWNHNSIHGSAHFTHKKTTSVHAQRSNNPTRQRAHTLVPLHCDAFSPEPRHADHITRPRCVDVIEPHTHQHEHSHLRFSARHKGAMQCKS